ncbi:hypothetical protein ABN028_23705 [Actinopolymorpha sp. B17G11]|uniref:WXG100-like domain-containing protein n=1 Tax=unclassified Actinopolymorpha TaxID=2627063 RepID=UPI0032D9294C
MWIPLPEELGEFLTMVGFIWPQADEELLWECGDAWQKFASTLRELKPDGDAAGRKVTATNADEAIAAFSEHWRKYAAEEGYLNGGADAADLVGTAFYTASIIVITLKIAVIAQLIYLAYTWAVAIAGAVETLGASLAAAAAQTVATRAAVKGLYLAAIKALKELGPRIVAKARAKLDDAIKRVRKEREPEPRKPRGGRPTPKNRQDAEDILDDGATIEKESKGKGHSKIAVRNGGRTQAESDFAEITEGLQVKSYPNGTKVAELPDGSDISLRSSSDGRTTISLQQKGQPDTKYRYDP